MDDRVYLVNPETNELVKSVNEELIKHGITEWRQPDNCPDCAANPETARKVHLAEEAIRKALEAMLPFFHGNPDPNVLTELFMSGYMAMEKHLVAGISET